MVKCHIKDVAEVPYSLLVTRVGLLSGLARSWSVPVYVLNGRSPSQGLEGDEEAPHPLGASPHPEYLPFLNAMQ